MERRVGAECGVLNAFSMHSLRHGLTMHEINKNLILTSEAFFVISRRMLNVGASRIDADAVPIASA